MQRRRSGGIGKAGIEPDLHARQRAQDVAQRCHLRAAALQRVEIGHVQLLRSAVRSQRAGHGHRLGARAQRGDDRPVRLRADRAAHAPPGLA